MSCQSSTSSLESLNESSTTKYCLEPYIHARTNYFEQKEYLLRHRSEICSDDNNEELNTRIGNTNWCICGNFSKMETSTESLCCCEMLEISDK